MAWYLIIIKNSFTDRYWDKSFRRQKIISLNWHAIRAINGGQEKGFQELITQLARRECPTVSKFSGKGNPDAGVECFVTYPDFSEWGWQAKYFFSLQKSQWEQIDASVKTALEKHPKLSKYYVCVPYDRPDARVKKTKTALQKWEEHVQHWTTLASTRGMEIQFIYWGSHEIIELLSRQENSGLIKFWFDIARFNDNWYKNRLEEAIKSAGPRYTPAIHVDLPIAQDFSAFGRTQDYINRIKVTSKGIREKLYSFKILKSAILGEIFEEKVRSTSLEIEHVLHEIHQLEDIPVGLIPFIQISTQIETIFQKIDTFTTFIYEEELKFEESQKDQINEKYSTPYKQNPYREFRSNCYYLRLELEETNSLLKQTDRYANTQTLLLTGEAGTGKTHLLCDVAQRRLELGLPTILLMGQRFTSNDEPWVQICHQLQLPGYNADEIIGAIEASAQAVNERALVLIDALNEGKGREIWKDHLPAFLTCIGRSKWIGIVVSVRSPYEKYVIPEEILSSIVSLKHKGFEDAEYDAVKTFFNYYDLELPSTPILTPEFSNPLFLKTLCNGLYKAGEKRLPRGMNGINKIFMLFIDKTNEELARKLNYDPRRRLVQKALDVIVLKLIERENASFLPLEVISQIVDSFLPDKDYENSLYHNMVAEGLLIESIFINGSNEENIVSISFERLCDYLTAKSLIDRFIRQENLESVFLRNEPLSFICDVNKYTSPGLIEAFCIQIPERFGKEFMSIAPCILNTYAIHDVFWKSIIWRDTGAFTEETKTFFNSFGESEPTIYPQLDTLLTVSSLPDHPYNAQFLDGYLRRQSMPERDSWWSLYLHESYECSDVIKKIIDWASLLEIDAPIDEEAIELCAIIISWMFSTSNRFLRDRVTIALVNLLAKREKITAHIAERMGVIDDPYIVERVYAAAYGVAMRCHMPDEIKPLALVVYNQIFAAGSPYPHILMRDYARGIIERALFLGSDLSIDLKLIRPPYKSVWPHIPSEEEIDPLLFDHEGPHKDEYGRNKIDFSVMSSDFARYVIGTNSSTESFDWITSLLSEPKWEPPPTIDEIKERFEEGLINSELEAWYAYTTADKEYDSISRWVKLPILEMSPVELQSNDFASTCDKKKSEALSKENKQMLKWNKAKKRLLKTLTDGHKAQFNEILKLQDRGNNYRRPTGFKLAKIQRYILWRVFNLGWTTERFGNFDQNTIQSLGRRANKAERIGKKYQWIAYHEILAYISDCYQYREMYTDGETEYKGPWQLLIRDIDPSITIKSVPRKTDKLHRYEIWWDSIKFNAFQTPADIRDWAEDLNNLPEIKSLLFSVNPEDGSSWILGHGYYQWKNTPPPDLTFDEYEHRELWYNINGYLVHDEDAQEFLDWASHVDSFMGEKMPEPPRLSEIFLGEHAWSPASLSYEESLSNESGRWIIPEQGCPVEIQEITYYYSKETTSFDCSTDDSFSLFLPAPALLEKLKVFWTGVAGNYLDASGKLVIQDPSAHHGGPQALLFERNSFQDYLSRNHLTICWAIYGSKRAFVDPMNGPYYPDVNCIGAYILNKGELKGFLKPEFLKHI